MCYAHDEDNKTDARPDAYARRAYTSNPVRHFLFPKAPQIKEVRLAFSSAFCGGDVRFKAAKIR